MFYYIEGTVTVLDAGLAVIDAGGVGYCCYTTTYTLAKLEKGKKKTHLTVHNAGSFIAPQDLPHIFERFYRADKTRGETQGHGLGLPILKKITELCGGTITAESDETAGTTFTVCFHNAQPAES